MTENMHVYRSSHPDVLAAWQLAQEEYDAYVERKRQQFEAWGFDPDTASYVSSSAFGGSRFHGIAWPEDQQLPQHWRRDRDTPGMIVPRRQSAAGKRMGDELAKLARVPTARAPLSKVGMPEMVMRAGSDGMRAYAPGAALRDNAVWVRWEIDPNPQGDSDRSSEHVDIDRWEQVPLSEYYARVESGADPFTEAA